MKKNFVAAFISIMLAFAGLVVSQPAQALVLNANGVALNFNEVTQTRVLYRNGVSTSLGSNAGELAGDLVVYRGVATISGTAVDAVIETVSVTSAAITSHDGGNAVSNQDSMFQSNIDTTNPGSVVFKFSFFTGGTYTGPSTGTAVTLQNVYINSYDLDQGGAGKNQYTQFTGVQSYTLSNNTTLAVSSSGNMLEFINTAAGANYSASDGAYTKGRVQVKYDNLSTISIKLGTSGSGTGSATNYFALDFSVGLAWTEGSTTIQTTSTQNSFNAAPTGTNDTKTVTESVAASLDANDFGTFTDADQNPRTKIRVETLPSNGTVEFYNGTAWAPITALTDVTEQDLTAGNLRYTSNAGTTTDTITFKVSDGLAYSTSTYTLTITVTAGGGGGSQSLTAQTITYAQPSDQLLSTGSITVAPTASSGLTVTLTSTTGSICTVNGFVISLVANGTCSTTASQAGDSTYAAATSVTRTFQITTPSQSTPAPEPVVLPAPTVFPSRATTVTTTPVTVTPSIIWVSANPGTNCLDIPETRACGSSYTVAGKGTFVVNANGSVTFTAAPGFIGEVSMWYRVVDRNGQDNQAPMTITVTKPELPAAPVVGPANGTTVGTTPITLTPAVTYPPGQATPSLCLVDPADNVCKQSVSLPGKGSFTLNSNGTVSFVAAPGFVGTATVQLRATDAFGQSSEAPITVVVTKPAAPVVEPSGGTTLVNQPITVKPNVTWPASYGTPSLCLVDPADNVCKQSVTLPGKGTFTLNSDGTVTFAPAKGFIGEATVQLRATDQYGQSSEAPITVRVTDVPSSQNGSTKGATPVVLAPEKPLALGSEVCLVDPNDQQCKTVVAIAGAGTWTQQANGSVKFAPVAGYVGKVTVMQRITSGAALPRLSPYTVVVAKKRGPVTITISGFADGSPVLTAAIKAKINAFLKAYSDYKNVTCIGYTEGPTVLATDAALSKQRALNACGFVKAGLGKTLVVKKIAAGQDTIEAAQYRRITITLND